MNWSTRIYCTIQQLCVFLFIMGPFAYFYASWMQAYHPGPIPTVGALWDIACLSLMFFALLILLDDVCTWLNNEFKTKH